MTIVQSFLERGNTAIVRYTKAEQERQGVREFGTLYEDDETSELVPFSDDNARAGTYDTHKEALRFLDRLDYFFDQYESKDWDFLNSIL